MAARIIRGRCSPTLPARGAVSGRPAAFPHDRGNGPPVHARWSLSEYSAADVDVNKTASITVNGTTVSASLVTVDYPFEFIMLQPIVNLVCRAAAPVSHNDACHFAHA